MTQRPNRPLTPETRVVQAHHHTDPQTGAVIPAIQPSATYARDSDYQVHKPYYYRRDGNETTEQAEAIIAGLENAETALLFSSGMSAATAMLELMPEGAHLVVPKVMYHGVLAQMQHYMARGRLRIDTYHAGDLESLRTALRPGETQLIWVETPNNPAWEVTDIAAAADLAHAAGARLLTDCTATPPSMTRALDLGADFSFHSATKYLNGHSDVTAGVISLRQGGEDHQALDMIRKLQGTVLQSFDAWLLIRGLRTLFLRVERACQNAMVIAQHFAQDPRIETVLYPGLPDHPGHQIARAQTSGQFGAMLSIIPHGSEQTAIDIARYCQIFYPATSLGGVESLIEHRKSVSGPDFPVHPRLLRLSVGIENATDLITDLEQALERATLAG